MRARLSWLNILGDVIQFLGLFFRSRTSLAAENLFLGKQLAFYQEREIKPRRADNPTRRTLVLLSRWFDWRSAYAREAQDPRRLAPQGLSIVLAVEVPVRAATDSAGAAAADSPHGER